MIDALGDTMTQQARTIPTNYSTRIIEAAVAISKQNYPLFLICSLILFFIGAIIGFIPFVGPVSSAIVSFLIGLAGFRFIRRLLAGEEMSVEHFFNLVFDMEILQKYQIYIAIAAIGGILTVAFQLIGAPRLALFITLINHWLIAFSIFAVTIQRQHPSLSWDQAFTITFQGVLKNFVTWFLLVIFTMILSGLSMFLCVIPFFLVFIPFSFPLNFLIFAAIFEDLDIDRVIEEWNAKAAGPKDITPPQ